MMDNKNYRHITTLNKNSLSTKKQQKMQSSKSGDGGPELNK